MSGTFALLYALCSTLTAHSLLDVAKCCFRDIDKVDELMQDITEQQELAQEISDAISKPVGFGEEFDEVRDTFQTFNFYTSEVYLWYFLSTCLIAHCIF